MPYQLLNYHVFSERVLLPVDRLIIYKCRLLITFAQQIGRGLSGLIWFQTI